MNAQEIFDKVVTHLRGMTDQSTWIGGCAYLGENGNRCAVGCLFPELLENAPRILKQADRFRGGVRELLKEFPIINERIGHYQDMLSDLQAIHDSARNWSNEKFTGEHDIKYVADKFSLIYTPPDEEVQT